MTIQDQADVVRDTILVKFYMLRKAASLDIDAYWIVLLIVDEYFCISRLYTLN